MARLGAAAQLEERSLAFSDAISRMRHYQGMERRLLIWRMESKGLTRR
jgi:hypothetical protein